MRTRAASEGTGVGEVTERVENAIRRMIDNGECAPGSKLPSERVLADSLDAGRTTVRLVLAKLAAQGRIEARHGSGYFVLPTESPNSESSR